eukprot:RCo044728
MEQRNRERQRWRDGGGKGRLILPPRSLNPFHPPRSLARKHIGHQRQKDRQRRFRLLPFRRPLRSTLVVQGLQARRDVQLLGLLPRKLRLLATEVPIGGSLGIYRAAKVQAVDDVVWAELEVGIDNLEEVGVAVLPRAVGVHVHRQRLGNGNGVSQLNQHPVGQPRRHQGLRHPACRVAGRAVDLGGVLAGERPAPVGAPPAVRVHDDLAPGQAPVGVGPAHHKAVGGIQVVYRVLVNEVLRDHIVDDLPEGFADLLVGGTLVVLLGDQHALHPHRFQGAAAPLLLHNLLVLHRDLRLAVRAHPGNGLVEHVLPALKGQLAGQLVGQRHVGGGLVGGIPEHQPLVPSAEVLVVDLRPRAVDPACDIWALLLNRDEEVEALVVQALGAVVVADLLHGVADDGLVIQLGLSGDLAEDKHHPRLAGGLTGDLGVLVLGQAGVQNGIADGITELVGVPRTHVLRGEQKPRHLLCHFAEIGQGRTGGKGVSQQEERKNDY